MDKYEIRRAALRKLVDGLGHGGISRVAEAIGKEPSYVSRMLYEEHKPGRKRIGEDTAELLAAAFPGWLLLDPTAPPTRQRASITIIPPSNALSALKHLSELVDNLSPLVREAGRVALINWANDRASDDETAAALDALTKASKAVGESTSSDELSLHLRKALGA